MIIHKALLGDNEFLSSIAIKSSPSSLLYLIYRKHKEYVMDTFNTEVGTISFVVKYGAKLVKFPSEFPTRKKEVFNRKEKIVLCRAIKRSNELNAHADLLKRRVDIETRGKSCFAKITLTYKCR